MLTSQESVDGFAAVRLANDCVSLAVLPELGARILSLVDVRTGREWMWRPPGRVQLRRNAAGDSFLNSPQAGADECLPTIQPCEWQGRSLPDHGELWNACWTLDQAALARGEISTSVRAPISPFILERTITLSGPRVHIAYLLRNQGSTPERWLWALHPLLRFEPDDRLELPDEVKNLRIEVATCAGSPRGSFWNWPSPGPDRHLDALQLENDQAYVKAFAGPLRIGQARLANDRRGDAITFRWETATNPYLGLWLTRGGFQGWHHIALEPTNAPADSLADAVRENELPILAPGAACAWWVELELDAENPNH